MTKTSFLLVCSILLSISVVAQDFDYRNLQLPDVQRHALTANLNPTFNLNSNERSGNLPFRTNMSGYINNRRDQFFYSASGNYIGSGNSSSSGTFARSMAPSLSASASYYKYSRNFFFIKPSFSTSLSLSKSRGENFFDSFTADASNTRYEGGLALGKGRIDPIDWAIRAGFMNESLIKAGAISRELSKAEWMQLSKAMAVIDRRRFYENRFYNINRTKMIDSLFDEFGIVSNDAAFFTTVVDQYFFAPQQGLSTGSRFEVFANYQDLNSRSEGRTNITGRPSESFENINLLEEIRTGIAFTHARPSNLHWHHLFSTGASYTMATRYQYEELNGLVRTEGNYFVPDYASAFMNYRLIFIPTTRTTLQWSIQGRAQYLNSAFTQDLSTSFDLNYFVSRRLQYSIGFNAFTNSNTVDGAGLQFSAGLAYQVW